jgi:hypothetical protein
LRVRTVLFKQGVLVLSQTTYDLSKQVFTSGDWIREEDSKEEKIAKRLMGVPYMPRIFINSVELEEGTDYTETKSSNVVFSKAYVLEK